MAPSLQSSLVAPRVPNIAAGFVDDRFAVVDLRRGRRRFSLTASAVTQLLAGLVTPSFDAPNIRNQNELAEVITETAEAAGLARKKRWSVALPEAVARTLIITLESKPANRRELDEILSWKLERVVAASSNELRISRQRLSPAAGQERYLLTVAREAVLSEYEAVFAAVGWQTGLLLPRHLGEAQWLVWDNTPGDKILVSGNRAGFTSVVVRNGEPVFVRAYVCEPEARADELHRFALYYRDRVAGVGAAGVTSLLALGGIAPAEASRAVTDAVEAAPHLLDPAQFGLDLEGEPIRFDHLAAAAGLATLAWQ